jgi:hypothetical protein
MNSMVYTNLEVAPRAAMYHLSTIIPQIASKGLQMPDSAKVEGADWKIQPRGLSKAQAAAYVGCRTVSSFSDWIRRGIMPGPIPGTDRWDIRALDAALDRLSGLQPTIAPQASPYDEWKAAQDARSA